MGNKWEVSKERMVEFLLEQCIVLQDKLDAVKAENGFGKSVLTNDGEAPEFQKTIQRLLAQIDRQDKWLRKRKDEVTILQNRIKELRERKEYYKDKAAHMRVKIVEKIVEPPVDEWVDEPFGSLDSDLHDDDYDDLPF